MLQTNKMGSIDVYQEQGVCLLSRKSNVTGSGLPEMEPHIAYLPVLAHESLWIDSELIPRDQIGELDLLYDGYNVNTDNNGVYYSKSGQKCFYKVQDRVPIAAIQKQVRILLTRGKYSEYTCNTVDLRLLVHENMTASSALLYRPALEYSVDGLDYQYIDDYMWKVDYTSGTLISSQHDFPLPHSNLYITAYFYAGRVGIDKSLKNPSTDDIHEGVINRYFTEELFTSFLHQHTQSDADNTINIGIQSSDDIVEGVVNKYLTSEALDSYLATKTMDDIHDGGNSRRVNASTMGQLGLSLGNIPEVHFDALLVPPSERQGKLYVEQSLGENVLYFGDTALNQQSTSDIHVATAAADIGEFHGEVTGATRGLHTGDVVGNVTGFVSDLSNHPILGGKFIGNGEGHWVGTVNADVVGKFEGYAKIMTGSIDNAYHVTIGTYDATASLHILASDRHIQLSHSPSVAAMIECIEDGKVSISCSALQTSNIECNSMTCFDNLNASDVYAGKVTCVGIANSFYGIYETGRVEGVSELLAESINVNSLCAMKGNVYALSANSCIADILEVNESRHVVLKSSFGIINTLSSYSLSVAQFHVERLSFDSSLFPDNPNAVFHTLSVGTASMGDLSIGNISLMNLTVLTGAQLNHAYITTLSSRNNRTNSLSVQDLYVSGMQTRMYTLSVASADISTIHSSQLNAHVLNCNTVHSSAILCDNIRTDSLSCCTLSIDTSVKATGIIANTIEAQIAVNTLLSSEYASMTTLSASTAQLSSCNAEYCNMGVAAISHLSVHLIDSDIHNATCLSAGLLTSGVLSVMCANICSIACMDSTVNRLNTQNAYIGTVSVHDQTVNNASVVSARVNELSVNKVSINDMHAISLNVDAVDIENAHIHNNYSNTLSCAKLVVQHALIDDILSAGRLNTASLTSALAYINNVDTDHANINVLSTGNAFMQNILVPLLSSGNITYNTAVCGFTSCSYICADTIASSRATIDTLSVNSIVGIVLPDLSTNYSVILEDLYLSVQTFVYDELAALSPSVDSENMRINNLSCTSLFVEEDVLVNDLTAVTSTVRHSISTSSLFVSHLSVGTIHGNVVSQSVSIAGIVSQISAAGLTCNAISCGTLFVDTITRNIPHISDTAKPAVLTTSNVGDFALFEEDCKHSGDLTIEGSLYVTDTIFMGTESAMKIDNVQQMTAFSISVSQLTVDVIKGATSSAAINNILNVAADDTIHEGNMHVDGNLIVSGVIVTGAFNELGPDYGAFRIDGMISVSGDIVSNGINLTQKLDELEQKIAVITANLSS